MAIRTQSKFNWYDLMTDDPKAALDFYAHVLGLTAETLPAHDGRPYHVVSAGGAGIGGVMELLPAQKSAGVKPFWVGYVTSDDVDTDLARLEKVGAKAMRAPTDIPGVGRFVPVTDPQGAGFMLFRPTPPPGAARPLPSGKGSVGWNELLTTDVAAAFTFYSEELGWTKSMTVDMGPMGPYQTFETAGVGGGMMKDPAPSPRARWRFYFQVESTTAALARVKEKGGQVVSGPHEVPGGEWTATCSDPQGAEFGMSSKEK
jgi:predicted enzyme related to lactoylglutathione lyase